MRPVLPFALLLGFAALLAAPSRASECADDSCVDGLCSDGSCRGDWSYSDEELCRRIPPPAQPGPHRCVIKSDVKDVKKTVYDVKWVPYCLPKASCPNCGDDCRRPCPECEKCVRWKKVVVKREVVTGQKCCYTCKAEECYPKVKHSAAAGHTDVPPTPAGAPPAPPAQKH